MSKGKVLRCMQKMVGKENVDLLERNLHVHQASGIVPIVHVLNFKKNLRQGLDVPGWDSLVHYR